MKEKMNFKKDKNRFFENNILMTYFIRALFFDKRQGICLALQMLGGIVGPFLVSLFLNDVESKCLLKKQEECILELNGLIFGS